MKSLKVEVNGVNSKTPVEYIASVSGGKDSIAMFEKILELGLPLHMVVFFDTGMEFGCIYHNMNIVKRKCIKRGIKFLVLHPKYEFRYQMIHQPIQGRKNGFHYGKGWCGGPCRWGTTQKTQSMGRYSKGKKEYLGIAYDEPKRLEKKRKGVKVYLLADLRMTEKQCLEYARSKGYNWREGEYDLYDLLDRVSCWCCKNKNLKELRNYYWFLPKYWNRLRALEKSIGKPLKDRYTLDQLEDRFRKEGPPSVRKRFPKTDQ